MAVSHLDEAWLDGSHCLERAAFKIKEVRSVCRRSLSKDADRVEFTTSILDLDLASHDSLNDLVPFFLGASPVDEDALKTLSEDTQNRYLSKLDFRREARVQWAENQVKYFLEANVVAYDRRDIGSLCPFVNRWKLAVYLILLYRNIIRLLATSKSRRVRLRKELFVIVYLAADRYEVCPFLLSDMSTTVLIVPGVELLHQATNRRRHRLKFIAAQILRVVNLSLAKVPVGVPSGKHEDSDQATANVVRAVD